jgi:hypothetical protein
LADVLCGGERAFVGADRMCVLEQQRAGADPRDRKRVAFAAGQRLV